MRVTRDVYDAMIAHAQDDRPFEACGVLAGSSGTVTGLHRARNTADLYGIRYEIDPRDFLKINQAIDDDLDLVGIYHSHPNSPAYPSATDRKLAAYDVTYFVISLKSRTRPSVRAYRICKQSPTDEEAEVREETVEIVDAAR